MKRAFRSNLLAFCTVGALLAGCNSAQTAFTPNAGVSVRPPSGTGYKIVHNFQFERGGWTPLSGVIVASDALYGTASSGGSHHDGTVYRIAGDRKRAIHTFQGGADGADPQTALTEYGGALYGVTYEGGGGSGCNGGCGTIFSISPSGANYTTLYAFSGASGAHPNSALVSMNGVLYGTTEGYGSSCKASGGSCGTVFSLTASGTVTTLYSFTDGADGGFPNGMTALNGVLYGTTASGGANGDGTIFSIASSGSESVVYSFKGGSDGSRPLASLTPFEGELYGTTYTGGNSLCFKGCGTVFASTTTGDEHVVFRFNITDGQFPSSRLRASHGAFYGTTVVGGQNGYGTVFSLTPHGKEAVLHDFTAGSTDGERPNGSLTERRGAFYGTTSAGGTSGHGTVFSIQP